MPGHASSANVLAAATAIITLADMRAYAVLAPSPQGAPYPDHSIVVVQLTNSAMLSPGHHNYV
jgi:hypothetical protein